MNIKRFMYEEDEVIECECTECGRMFEKDKAEELDYICDNCNGEIVNDWAHEGLECCNCGRTFECDEDCYRNKDDFDELLCKDCYKELEE